MDDFFDPESEALIVKPSSSLSSIRQSNTYHRHHHQPKYQNQWAQLFQSDQDSSQRQNISGHDANPDVHKQKRTPTNEGPPNKAHTNVSHLTSKFSFYVWTASFVGCLVLEAVSVIGFFLYGLHVSIALSLSTMAAFLFFAMSIVGQANKGMYVHILFLLLGASIHYVSPCAHSSIISSVWYIGPRFAVGYAFPYSCRDYCIYSLLSPPTHSSIHLLYSSHSDSCRHLVVAHSAVQFGHYCDVWYVGRIDRGYQCSCSSVRVLLLS